MSTNGASDDTIAAYAAQLLDLEADLEATQGAKKDVYANARETYGKRFADSLKLAIKRHRMDADKRDAADEIDAEAERMLAVIRAPRATHTRTREIIEEFDAETGEILTSSQAGHPPVRQPSLAGAEGEADRQPIPEPLVYGPAVPLRTGAAEGNEAGAAAQETHAASPPQAEIAEPGEGSAVDPAAALLVAGNVVAIRTHNPETHFLNSTGLQRLHGCLKPEVCGSSEPRKRLCFDCSRLHDGPTQQDGAA